MTRRLEGKVAIITGAGSVGPGWGNGRATAVRFAEEGAKIFAVDREAERLRETVEGVKKAGGVIATHLCDVTKGSEVTAMVEACVKAFGRVDVLVNNVGGSAPGGPAEMSEETWDAQIDFNLKSVVLGCKYVLPAMERQGGGAIGNIASTSGLRLTGNGTVGYAAAKAGAAVRRASRRSQSARRRPIRPRAVPAIFRGCASSRRRASPAPRASARSNGCRRPARRAPPPRRARPRARRPTRAR